MAKIRVPKEHRPPERHKGFMAPPGSDPQAKGGTFRVIGKYRPPREGEWFWYWPAGWGVGLANFTFVRGRCVILEKVG